MKARGTNYKRVTGNNKRTSQNSLRSLAISAAAETTTKESCVASGGLIVSGPPPSAALPLRRQLTHHVTRVVPAPCHADNLTTRHSICLSLIFVYLW